MRRAVREARVGRLATVTPDGRPHVVPCCFTLGDDVVYTAVDTKPKTSRVLQRIRNIAANPAACLLVDHYDEEWSRLWWVRIDGRARLVDVDAEEQAALASLAAKYPQYTRDAPPGPVIAIDVVAWRSWP